MWLVFILLIISFGDQVFHFNTIQSVSIFSFMDYTFVISIHPLPNPRSCRFSPIMSFRSFIVFHRISALLSFWVNFYKRSKTRSWLIFFFCTIVAAPIIEKTILFPQNFLCFFVKDQVTSSFDWEFTSKNTNCCFYIL